MSEHTRLTEHKLPMAGGRGPGAGRRRTMVPTMPRHATPVARLLPMLLLTSAYPTIGAFRQPPRWARRRPTDGPPRSKIIARNAAVEPEFLAGAAAAVLAAAGAGAAIWRSGSDDRTRRADYAEYEARERAILEERTRSAYVEPRDGGGGTWTEAELAGYDGTVDEDGPLLLAVDGNVFNVWKGRHFYGPGGEYQVMAGRDATRLLAKSRLEEETEEEAGVPLNIAERAALEGWLWTFKSKYEIVGRLEGYDPKETKM